MKDVDGDDKKFGEGEERKLGGKLDEEMLFPTLLLLLLIGLMLLTLTLMLMSRPVMGDVIDCCCCCCRGLLGVLATRSKDCRELIGDAKDDAAPPIPPGELMELELGPNSACPGVVEVIGMEEPSEDLLLFQPAEFGENA